MSGSDPGVNDTQSGTYRRRASYRVHRHVCVSSSRHDTSVNAISSVSSSRSLCRQHRPHPSHSDSHCSVVIRSSGTVFQNGSIPYVTPTQALPGSRFGAPPTPAYGPSSQHQDQLLTQAAPPSTVLPPAAQAASVNFVLGTIAVDALAFGIIVPVVPTLVMDLTGLTPSAASIRMGALLAVFSLMQFLCAPLLGALSDRYGRRPVLLLSLAGICANNLLLAAAPTLAWLFVGRVLAGATAANFAAATASIADVSTPEQRVQRFGLVGAMFGLGFVIGPALGGWLGAYGLRVPFLAAAALAGANVIYGAIFVPETLAPENRRPFTWRTANPFGTLATVAHDPNYARLVLAWCCTWFALGALQSSFVLANDLRLGWGPQQNGLALAAVGVGSAVVQGLLVRRIVPRLGERRAALVGYAFSAAGYVCFALAGRIWILAAGIVLQAVGAIAGPAVQSMVSAGAGPSQQGERQGALASFQGLTAIGAPVLAGWVFGVFTGPAAPLHLPGAPFAMAAVAYLVDILSVRGWRPGPVPTPVSTPVPTPVSTPVST